MSASLFLCTYNTHNDDCDVIRIEQASDVGRSLFVKTDCLIENRSYLKIIRQRFKDYCAKVLYGFTGLNNLDIELTNDEQN